jgi:hypothetical protein
MLEQLETYDWHEAFGYAGEEGTCAPDCKPTPVAGATCTDDAIKREDVTTIYGYADGEPDSLPWLIAGKLKDGRHFYLEASCDYTGWD